MAVTEFLDLGSDAKIVRIEPERGAGQPHRLDGALERARYEIEVRDGRHDLFQHLAVTARLRNPGFIQWDVALPLIASFPIPIGLAVTNEIERDSGL